MAGEVEVVGLRDVVKALRAAGADIEEELKGPLREIAEEAARAVRGKVPVKTGRWRDSITAGATQRAAYVAWGKGSVPYAPWLEFGGTIKPRGTDVRRPWDPRGRYVFPTVRAMGPELERRTEEMLERVLRRNDLT